MQQGQIEQLKRLINTSPVLSTTEKAEWLDMLILMNDKQAAELEEILAAHHAAAPPATSPSPRPARPSGPVPSLFHISNLPSGIPRTPPPNLPKASSAALPWKQQFQVTMTEKELPPPKPAQDLHTQSFTPPRPAAVRPPAPPPVSPRPAAPRSSKFPPASQAQSVGSLETIADAGKLTVATLRRMALPDLLIRLQQLSKMEGYFNLLSYLEDSPLYKSYLATGKKVLTNQSRFDGDANDIDTLTKPEFEAFADILRKIQLN